MTPELYVRLKRNIGEKDGMLTWSLPEFGVVLEGKTEEELQRQSDDFLGGLVEYKRQYGSATFRKFLDSRNIKYEVAQPEECLLPV